jgi:hypothetical protein
MHALRRNVRLLVPTDDLLRSTSNTRLVECLPSSSSVPTPIFQDQRLGKIFQRLHGYRLAPMDFPSEYRVYPATSPGMGWHDDTVLTVPYQSELVITLTNNNSNTRVVWEPLNKLAEAMGAYHNHTYGDVDDPASERVSVTPAAGDVMIVLAGTAMHKVTTLDGGGGARSIIKLVAHAAGARKTGSYRREKRLCDQQHQHGKGTGRCVCGPACECR